MNQSIFTIIDRQKLDVVSESIEKAHGLPNECYLNGAYTEIERKKIFESVSSFTIVLSNSFTSLL